MPPVNVLSARVEEARRPQVSTGVRPAPTSKVAGHMAVASMMPCPTQALPMLRLSDERHHEHSSSRGASPT